MSLIVILRVALKALARNKMRTTLTMLGMIIGVAAVITMVALGNGAQQQIEEQAEAAGTNLITVRAGNWHRGGVSMGVGGAPTLKVKDVEAIREQVPGHHVYRGSREHTGPSYRSRTELVGSNRGDRR